MKKLLTLAIALVMLVALAVPVLAANWDAPEAGEDPIPSDFVMEAVRLEYFPGGATPTTYSFGSNYYQIYNPDAKGIVAGSFVRAYYYLALPVLSDLSKAMQDKIRTDGGITITFSGKNLAFDGGEMYGDNGKVKGSVAANNTVSFKIGVSEFPAKNISGEFEFNVWGHAATTADVKMNATIKTGTGFQELIEDKVSVFYFYSGTTKYTVFHDYDGWFEIDCMKKGNYTVTFEIDPDTDMVLEVYIAKYAVAAVQDKDAANNLLYVDADGNVTTNANTVTTVPYARKTNAAGHPLYWQKNPVGSGGFETTNPVNLLTNEDNKPLYLDLNGNTTFDSETTVTTPNKAKMVDEYVYEDWYKCTWSPKSLQFVFSRANSMLDDPKDDVYKGYAAAFDEILNVLGFDWKTTKDQFMYEDKYVENFGAAINKSAETLEWKAYTTSLIVPDSTTPPQTGDNASIIGFVMIALALMAAAAVVIKKVRA